MIRLIKTNRGRAILETHPLYDVTFDGKVIGQLYFNMTRYTGCYLPTPEGIPLNVGECGIGQYRRRIAELNREWKDHRN